MRQTLFTIDHYLFTDHWILIAWVVLGLLLLVYHFFAGSKKEAIGFLPIFLIVAVVIHFVLPNLETMGVNPEDPNGPLVPSGLAVRGYGLFLLFAMVGGLGLALYRCHQVGFDGDRILSLGFWMVVVGIIGARLFYIVQKYDQFSGLEGNQLIFKFLDMTSGGLVVYGSLIGGLVAAVVYMSVHRMPWRRVVDILAPGMALGLAIGRIGCLMNGCCYGDVCDDRFPGIQFPAASPVYVEQLYSGRLLGIEGDYDEKTRRINVATVENNSLASKYGIASGDELEVYLFHEQQDDMQTRLRAAKQGSDMDVSAIVFDHSNERFAIPVSELPEKSLKTHPTQIYSAVNAGLLCAFLWFYFPYRRSDGEVFALMLILYSVGRFLLEIIRRDEGGQFGTALTISQWISIATFAAGIGLIAYVRSRPVNHAD